MLSALSDSIVFFNSPTDVVEKHLAPGTRIRLGGLVKHGQSCSAATICASASTSPTAKATIAVRYQGIVPDLFREGQGVVAEGTLEPRRHVRCRHRARQA